MEVKSSNKRETKMKRIMLGILILASISIATKQNEAEAQGGELPLTVEERTEKLNREFETLTTDQQDQFYKYVKKEQPRIERSNGKMLGFQEKAMKHVQISSEKREKTKADLESELKKLTAKQKEEYNKKVKKQTATITDRDEVLRIKYEILREILISASIPSKELLTTEIIAPMAIPSEVVYSVPMATPKGNEVNGVAQETPQARPEGNIVNGVEQKIPVLTIHPDPAKVIAGQRQEVLGTRESFTGVGKPTVVVVPSAGKTVTGQRQELERTRV